MATEKRTTKKSKKLPKIFVLDTNIPLHDFNAIRQFADNDIVIPVAVLEELDIHSSQVAREGATARMLNKDTDEGKEIQEQIDCLIGEVARFFGH